MGENFSETNVIIIVFSVIKFGVKSTVQDKTAYGMLGVSLIKKNAL